MSKGDKYIALTSYLEMCNKNQIGMSFKEIERVLGFALPDSAYKYPAIWSNSDSHPLALGWLNAGYMSRNLNLTAQTIEFYRTDICKDKIMSQRQNHDHKTSRVDRKQNLPVDEAIRCIRAYFYETVKDKNGRYLSWQHCYNVFKEKRGNLDDSTIDYLSLNLAFYLASWGMYRGSSFLLKKDYKVHIPIVKIILEERYNPLMGISAEEIRKDSNLELIEEIDQRIRKAYAEIQPSFEDSINNATDTLVTKILLGTLGCAPAYDRYYVESVKAYDISSGKFNIASMKDVAGYYVKHKELFELIRDELSLCGTDYPPMKLMDMCMWQLAYEKDNGAKI